MDKQDTTRRTVLKQIPRYLSVALLSPSLSSQASTQPSSTPPTEISSAQADKNLTILSVRDFGAKGDGSDDSSGIAAAIAQAKKKNGARIMLEPGGKYKCASSINIAGDFGQGLEIIGQNSIIQATHDGPCISVGNYAEPASEYRIKFRMSGVNVAGSGSGSSSSSGSG